MLFFFFFFAEKETQSEEHIDVSCVSQQNDYLDEVKNE